MATLLSIVQGFCGRTNIPVPSVVIGTTDDQVVQVMRLLEEEGTDLSRRTNWQALTKEATFTSVALESQGLITTIASSGFRSIENGTFWNRSSSTRVVGPLSSKEWQEMKGQASSGPTNCYRMRGGELLLNPIPEAGQLFYFEYLSDSWITGGIDLTPKSAFSNDADTVNLDAGLLTLGLRWRWKKENGLEYAEDFRTYEQQVAALIGSDGGKRVLNMGGKRVTYGVRAPEGNWPLP